VAISKEDRTMIKLRIALLIAAFATLTSAARALEADDVVRLAKAGAGDEVIVAQIKVTKARFALTADEIVRLKKEGVSDAVVKAMIETAVAAAEPAPAARAPEGERPAAAREAPAPARAAEAPAEPGREAQSPAGELGTLILENLDSRDYSVQIDAQRGNIFYWKGTGSAGRELLPARSSLVYRVSPGGYTLRWVGEKDGYTLLVASGKESRATLTRTQTEDGEAASLSLFEDGERRGGGRLATLAARPAPEPSRTAEAPASAVVERHYYYGQPQEVRVVEPRTVYYAPAYRSARYYQDDLRWLPAFGYGWTRGKSSYGIGWGPGGNLGFTWHKQLGRSGYTFSWGW
jgi:hypothetical protein